MNRQIISNGRTMQYKILDINKSKCFKPIEKHEDKKDSTHKTVSK